MQNLTNYATSLQAKILSINTINQDSQTIVNYELLQLNKFIGQNILKVDGSFKAKINYKSQDSIKFTFNKYGFNWWTDTNYYFSLKYGRLTLNIKTCIRGGGVDKCDVNKHCIYENKTVDLFIIDEIGNLQPLKTEVTEIVQFNENDILESQKQIELASKVYEKILASMPYQFRDVTNCQRLIK